MRTTRFTLVLPLYYVLIGFIACVMAIPATQHVSGEGIVPDGMPHDHTGAAVNLPKVSAHVIEIADILIIGHCQRTGLEVDTPGSYPDKQTKSLGV